MKKSWLKDAPVDELVDAYEQAAVKYGRATEEGDYKTVNKNADIIIKIYAELRSRGREAQMALLPLLAHEEPGVRCSVGSHSLEFAPEQGEPVLSELALIQKSFVGMSAGMALEQWRKGALRFP